MSHRFRGLSVIVKRLEADEEIRKSTEKMF